MSAIAAAQQPVLRETVLDGGGKDTELLSVDEEPVAPRPEPVVRLIVTGRKGNVFKAAGSASAVSDALYQMRRYGWTVTVEPESAR